MRRTIELVSMEAEKDHRMAGEHSELAASAPCFKKEAFSYGN